MTKDLYAVSHLTLLTVCIALASSPSLSQAAPPKAPSPAQPAAMPCRAHQLPCWEQVGISKSAMERRRSIEQNARAQVDSICSDTSLTSSEEREKIQEIRQQAREQIEAIIQPQHLQELKTCNAERAGRRPASAPAPHPGGPCEAVSANPRTAAPEREPAEGTPSQPNQE